MCRISLFAGITADLRDFAASIRRPSLSQNPLCALFSTAAVSYFTEISFVVNASLTTER
jgi:hypothetical protein